MEKVTMVKPGMLTLNVGTAVIRKLQEALNYVGRGLTQEDMNEYAELFKKGVSSDNFPKEWMKHVYNLSFLIKLCEDAAVMQGFTYDKDIDQNYSSLEELLKPE